MSSKALTCAAALLSLLISAAVSAQVADAYTRCAACHLEDGSGIPGAFPPLKNRVAAMAASEQGRAYLVNVINVGLIGPIDIGGVRYIGVMPAQGGRSYGAKEISEVLNYAVLTLDSANVGANWTEFTLDEVQMILEESAARTGQDAAKMREELLLAYPELQ